MSSLWSHTRRVVLALASRPPGEAGDRIERASARTNRDLVEPGSVVEWLHAVPQRGWQHLQRAVSLRRGWTFSALIRMRLRAPWRPFGVSVVHRRERTVLCCETQRHALRPGGTRSLLSGKVGGDRVAAATSRQGSSRTSHRSGVSGPRNRGDGIIASADEPTSMAGNRR